MVTSMKKISTFLCKKKKSKNRNYLTVWPGHKSNAEYVITFAHEFMRSREQKREHEENKQKAKSRKQKFKNKICIFRTNWRDTNSLNGRVCMQCIRHMSVDRNMSIYGFSTLQRFLMLNAHLIIVSCTKCGKRILSYTHTHIHTRRIA